MQELSKVPNSVKILLVNEYNRVHLPGNVTLEFFRVKEMLHVPKLWRNIHYIVVARDSTFEFDDTNVASAIHISHVSVRTARKGALRIQHLKFLARNCVLNQR
jgi:hypothetical protein